MTIGQNILMLVGVVVFCAHAWHLYKIFHHWMRTRFLKAESMNFSAQELVHFSRAFYKYSPGLEDRVENMKDAFLREALRSYLTGAVRGHEWLHILRAKAESYRLSLYTRLQDIHKLVTLLPALGWIIGISAIGTYIIDGPESWSTSKISFMYGAVLAAIVYGLCLFHLVVHPMALRIEQHARETYEKNVFLIQALGHLVRKKSTLELYESVNLLLPIDAKFDWSELPPAPTAVPVGGGGGTTERPKPKAA